MESEHKSIDPQEEQRLTNHLDVCHRNAKLYGFFLGIAHSEVFRIVHQEEELPTNGTEMYNYLQKRVEDYYHVRYEKKISECEFLLQHQKKKLLDCQARGEMDLNELDFTMYMQIYKLAGGTKYANLCKYMNFVRNKLCHVSFISIHTK